MKLGELVKYTGISSFPSTDGNLKYWSILPQLSQCHTQQSSWFLPNFIFWFVKLSSTALACLASWLLCNILPSVDGIWCWKENDQESLAKMNCNEVSLTIELNWSLQSRRIFQEFQREEMYCINKTDRYSQKLLARGCHALQWFEDKVTPTKTWAGQESKSFIKNSHESHPF